MSICYINQTKFAICERVVIFVCYMKAGVWIISYLFQYYLAFSYLALPSKP